MKREIKPFKPGFAYFAKENGGAVLFIQTFNKKGFTAKFYYIPTQKYFIVKGSFAPFQKVKWLDIPFLSADFRFLPTHPFQPVLGDFVNNFKRFTNV